MQLQQCSFTTNTRGQSYTIGTVLILAMALVGTIGTAGAGFIFLEESQDQAREDRATHAMSELNSEISLVALDNNAESSSINFERTNNEEITVQPGGSIRVETLNETDGSVEDVVVNENLGVIEYQTRGSERSVAYQGGGVWRHYGQNSSTMVSPPEVHYRGGTLTMPLIVVNSEQSVNPQSSDVQVNRHAIESAFPTENRANPIEEGQIRLTVESKYYQGWGEFFENRIGGEVTIDDATQEASVTLEAPDDTEAITSGLSSTQSGSEVTIRGSGGQESFIDSYNSDEGDYETTQSENGTITATSDILLRGGAQIYGDAIVPPGNVVDARGGSEVTGEIRNEEVNTGNVDGAIRSEITTIQNTNNNDETDEIVNGQLDNSQNTWTLTAGDYYIDGDLRIGNNEKLNIDTSDGNVNIAVDGDIDVRNGDIEVIDSSDNTVRMYMKGDDLTVQSSDVTVPEDRSTRMWMYAQSGLQAEFSSGSEFIGVVYAPDDEDGSGETNIQSQATIYGAVVGGQSEMQSGGVIHYDQALAEQEVFETTDFSPVTYLHISINEVTINDTE